MNRFGYRALVGATTALLAAVTAPAASAQTTYYACRVPGVNIIYIRGALVTDTCIDGAHVPFQWTDGGAPPDGSITTAKLADNAVTSVKIADGVVATADLANAAVTTAKIAVPARAAYSTSGSLLTLTTGRQNVTSVSITVGGAGNVVVQGTATTQLSAGNCSYIYYGISKTSAGAPNGLENYANRPDYGATGIATYAYHSLNTNFMDTVASAGTYTYYFVAYGPGTGSCQVIPMGMTAIFIPS